MIAELYDRTGTRLGRAALARVAVGAYTWRVGTRHGQPVLRSRTRYVADTRLALQSLRARTLAAHLSMRLEANQREARALLVGGLVRSDGGRYTFRPQLHLGD